MRAARLHKAADIMTSPLVLEDVPKPVCMPNTALIKVSTCGLCRTDLHVIEGELGNNHYPIIPGHQVVGTIGHIDGHQANFRVGDRVGLAWLQDTCGQCVYCRRGDENLCEKGTYTGWTAPGGYAEYVVAPLHYLYKIPENYDDVTLAPLLCAGIIGYRSLKLMTIKKWKDKKIGIYGFGNAAHIAIQFLLAWGAQVYVVTRDKRHQDLAKELGATWVGGSDDILPMALDASVIFAPAGELVPLALKALDRGGRLVCAGIHMSPIPSFDYKILYGERSITSVTNNTRQDGIDFLKAAEQTPLTIHAEVFSLDQVNEALQRLKNDAIRGAGVVRVS